MRRTVLVIMVFAIIVSLGLLAQDAIVITILASDTVELSKKYAAYDQAKAEWEAVRTHAVKRYSTEKTPCGLKFSARFEYAIPDACPEPHPYGGFLSSPVNGITLTQDNNSVGWK